MNDLVGLAIAILSMAFGAAIWLGAISGWVNEYPRSRSFVLLFTWGEFGFFVGAFLPRAFEILFQFTWPVWILSGLDWIAFVVVLFGIISVLTGRPRWALPPWLGHVD